VNNVAAWCQRKGLAFFVSETNGYLHLPHPANQDWSIRVIPREDRNMISFGLVVPFEIPADRFEEIERTISYLNSRTFMGAWVLNHGSNSLYFRVTLPSGDSLYSDEGLLFVIQVIFGTSNASGQVLQKVALEGGTHELAKPQATS